MSEVDSTRDRGPLLDGHFHIFLKSLNLADNPRHRPQYDATANKYLTYQSEFGLAGGLLVQPSFLGTDNSFLLSTLHDLKREAPTSCFRGVAVVSPDISDSELERLDASGIVGVRFNLIQRDLPAFGLPAWRSLLERVNGLNWHTEIQIEGARLPQALPALTSSCRRVVVDHFGRPDSKDPMRCPGHQALINDKSGRLWVKISAPYRVFPTLPREEAAYRAGELGDAYAASLGEDSLLWGSDWPWTQYEDGMSWAKIMRWRTAWTERFGLRGLRTLAPQFDLIPQTQSLP